MEYGIVMRIVGVEDDGMLTVAIDVSSGGFRGSSQLYTIAPELAQFCADLRRFPDGTGRPLEFRLGVPDSYAYFGARFALLDARGRWQCRVWLESNYIPIHGPGSKNRMDVEMAIEPNAIDRFASDLDNMLSSKTGEAVLEGIGKY